MACTKEASAIYRKMRLYRIQRGLLFLCFTVMATVIYRSYFFVVLPYLNLRRSMQPACVWPQLDINNSQLAAFFRPVPPLECDPEVDWVSTTGDGVSAGPSVDFLQRHPAASLRCNYTFFRRATDHTNEVTGIVHDANGTVALQSDFFQVHCAAGGSNRTWRNLVAAVRRDPVVVERPLGDALSMLNVLIFGYDSLSRMTFLRKMPRTYGLLKELGAVVLQKYNIVGDGTPQALIPILTGRTEVELPETRKRKGDLAQHVDVYPFVWNEFRNAGYVTAFAEDCPSIGTFTYRLKGFDRQPTDHYMRPFYIELDKVVSEQRRLCLGSKPRHKVMMDYLEELFDVYDQRPKFAFGFHGELSHDDYNLVELADNDMFDMLTRLKDKGHLNRTMLMVMSDHGHRFAKIRETQQGKQEERLPFFSITMPPWFKTHHSLAWSNLMVNSERLTSPFDIYPTLRNVLNFKDFNDGSGSTKPRSISLFKEVPITRTCTDADIEAHWCACLQWEPEPIDSRMSQKGAQSLVDYFNELTSSHRDLCEVLTVDGIVRVEKYIPQTEMLKYKKNADADGFVGDFSDETVVSQVIYQVKIVTSPGNGHFEASLNYDVASENFMVQPNSISRVNAYSNDVQCIMNIQEDLRKYCYCRNRT